MQTMHILGWKINAYDYDGRTALGIAASEGHMDAVKYLVCHGANITHKDIRGNTAIDDARREGRHDVVAYLEE
jgi:ankyrin repeat protein